MIKKKAKSLINAIVSKVKSLNTQKSNKKHITKKLKKLFKRVKQLEKVALADRNALEQLQKKYNKLVVKFSDKQVEIANLELENKKLKETLVNLEKQTPVSLKAASHDEEKVGTAIVINEENDDLTKIKGIGKVTAAKLNDLGIYTFQQLTELQQQPEREKEILQQLSFAERLRKNNWLEQAKEILK